LRTGQKSYSPATRTTQGHTESIPGTSRGKIQGSIRQRVTALDFRSKAAKVDEREMEVTESILCPFCGQRFELTIDTSVPTQRFTTDCEVCCRPFEVIAECVPGEIRSLDVVDQG